jgi:hypothetical protein
MDELLLVAELLLLGLPFVALFYLMRNKQESKQKGKFPDVGNEFDGPPVIPPTGF